MKRLAAVSALALVLPIAAWRAVGADAQQTTPPPCDSTTTTLGDPADPVDPADPADPAVTASGQECTPVAELAPVPPTPPTAPLPPSLPPSLPVDSTTTTTIFDPNTTTTTLDPNATTTTPPPPTDPPTTVAPSDTAPPPAEPPPVEPPPAEPPPAEPPPAEPPPVEETPPPPPETTVPPELETAPVEPAPAPEAGRVLAPTGVTETGQVRPITFPVAGPARYSNDFGACRDGCRRQHKGNDIIGDRLQPMLAMRDGVVDRLLDHPTAGFGIVIQDAEGWEYHIYHVNNDSPGTDDGADDGTWRFAPGIMPGAPVTAGQVVAWMGDSGNSEGSVPHAHVEIHTPSGAAVNPFWSLRMAQRDVNCAIPTIVDPAGAVTAAPTPDPTFLQSDWSSPEMMASLPGEWRALTVTGGRPGSTSTAARMWIGPAGFTPVDDAALRVGDPRYDQDCAQPVQAPAQIPAELGAILATIRAMETGGNYTTQVTSSTASGAYGFLDGSWGRYGGYARARDAPPEVQDAKAAELATSILNRNNGDVSTIPVSWYIGHVPIGAEWDTVPPVGANTITPREYQTRWLRMYGRILGQPDAWVGTAPAWTAVDTSATCRTVVIDVGSPEQPQYALTQAHTFGTDGSGRAIAAASDPCDPNRPVPEPPPTAAPTLRPAGPN